MIDLEHLLRRLDQSEPATSTSKTYKKKSDKFPALNTNSNVLAFKKLTCNEIKKLKISLNCHDNLLEAKRKSLKSLADNSMITIKPSDKEAVLSSWIMRTTLLFRILLHISKQWYCKISSTLIEWFHQEFYNMADEADANQKPNRILCGQQYPAHPLFTPYPNFIKACTVHQVDLSFRAMVHWLRT